MCSHGVAIKDAGDDRGAIAYGWLLGSTAALPLGFGSSEWLNRRVAGSTAARKLPMLGAFIPVATCDLSGGLP